MNFSSNWSDLHAQVMASLRQKKLLPEHSSILVAVSGGQDSLCLLKLLSDLQPRFGWQLAIAHCDHCWSTDAGIAAHVEKIAGDFAIPFYLQVNSHPDQESEAAARHWRYQALTEIAQTQGFSIVVTGHTRSDRSETLFYNLIRGAGADGLVSLGWQRPLTEGITLVRPLLQVARQETGNFCAKFQLPVWEDVVNQKLHYARNRIRQEVFPYLEKHFHPQVEKNLAQTVELLTEEVIFLQSLAETILEKVISDDRQCLNRILLRDHPLAIQRRVIRLFLLALLPKNPNFEQIEAVTALIDAPNRSCTSSLPGRAIAQVQGVNIVLLKN